VRSRNRRLVSLLLVALASVAALALSACGGDDDSGDATQQLRDAFKTPIKSANVSLDMSAKVDGVPQLSQPVSMKLTGPFETRGENKVPKLDWDVNVSGAGQTFTGSLASTGDNAFIGFQGQNYEVGTEAIQQFEQQAAQQNQQQGLSPEQLGIDPGSWVKDAKEDGEEDVAGTKTTKITGGLDVEKMLGDLNSAVDKAGPRMGQNNAQKLTPEQINQVKQVVKDPTFEAFVAEDKTLRRMTATINFTIPESQRQQASGATGGNVRFSIQFANVGQPAQVEAPTDAKPLSELQEQIQSGGLGGIGGSGSQDPGSSGSGDDSGSGSGDSGSGGSGGEQAPSSEDFEKYAQCLEDAQGDSAAIEECSKLLR
jgi:hypothetical protein